MVLKCLYELLQPSDVNLIPLFLPPHRMSIQPSLQGHSIQTDIVNPPGIPVAPITAIGNQKDLASSKRESAKSKTPKIDTNLPFQQELAATSLGNMESPILARMPSDGGYTSGGTTKTQSQSRRRRSRSRRRGPKAPDLAQAQEFDFLSNLKAAAESNPTLASQLQALALAQGVETRIPSGSSSSTFELPYTNPQAMTQQNRQQQKGSRSRKQQGGPIEQTPVVEHPVQVPVRVVNPEALPDTYIPGRGATDSGNKGSQGNLRLRLDLNLDVEITLKATIRGDLTLALL